MTIQEAMMRCAVLQQAAPASIAALANSASLRWIKKGKHLFWDKEQSSHLFFVAEGCFSLYKQNSVGEKKVIFVYGVGEMLNEVMLHDVAASISCEAFSHAAALCFPMPTFARVMEEDPLLTNAVMHSMAHKIRRLYRQMKNTIGSIRGDKRIAAKLWKLSQDHGVPCGSGTRIPLSLSITYLADMLGAKRETVSRQMKLLTDAGLVLPSPEGFIIPNRDKLREYFKAP